MTHALRLTAGLAAGAALLAAPVLATAAPAPTHAPSVRPLEAQPQRYTTHVHWLTFDHTKFTHEWIHLRGQVLARVGDRQGSLPKVKVKLYRQYPGESTWHYLRTKRASQGIEPTFEFNVAAVRNTRYRVAFEGNERLLGSRSLATTGVHSIVGGKPYTRHGQAQLFGQVKPRYRHGPIYLQRKLCSSCRWKTLRKSTTNGTSHWHFSLGTPRHGRFKFRVFTPKTATMMRSYSGLWYTYRG